MGRRYEEVNDMDEDGLDNYDDYSARYRPARSKKYSGQGVSRYEVPRQSLRDLQSSRKAKFIFVYTNEKLAKEEKPLRLPFSRKKFPGMKSLLDEISTCNKKNVQSLFKWPSCDQVFDVTEIEEDEETCMFVWSSGKTITKKCFHGGVYGLQSSVHSGFDDKYSRNSHDSRRSDKPSRGQQLHIHIISNIDRKSKQSLLIDPNGKQSFEEILKNIEGMVRVNPPCKALVTKSSPYVKVQSISTLKSVIPKHGYTFYACGREGDVREKLDGSPNESPTRNGQRRMKNGIKQNGHQQQRDDGTRQTNGHMKQSDSKYDQYEDDDEVMEDYNKPQQGRTSPEYGHNKRNMNQNDNVQSQKRQSQRYEDENDDSEERNNAQQTRGRQRRDSSSSSHHEDKKTTE